MPNMLSRLEFGSLLAYATHPKTDEQRYSRDVMLKLKKNTQNGLGDGTTISTADLVARRLVERRTSLPFAHYFGPEVTAIPIPSSSLKKKDSLWVPYALAQAMQKAGLVGEVLPCAIRRYAVNKAATSLAKDRPLISDHYKSVEIQRTLISPASILLVDDVVTRGATFLGVAKRVLEAFPGIEIRCFAAMRAISDETKFQSLVDPCQGLITLTRNGQAHREP